LKETLALLFKNREEFTPFFWRLRGESLENRRRKVVHLNGASFHYQRREKFLLKDFLGGREKGRRRESLLGSPGQCQAGKVNSYFPRGRSENLDLSKENWEYDQNTKGEWERCLCAEREQPRLRGRNGGPGVITAQEKAARRRPEKKGDTTPIT